MGSWKSRGKEATNEQDTLSCTLALRGEISPLLTNSTHVCMKLQGTARNSSAERFLLDYLVHNSTSLYVKAVCSHLLQYPEPAARLCIINLLVQSRLMLNPPSQCDVRTKLSSNCWPDEVIDSLTDPCVIGTLSGRQMLQSLE